MDMGFIMMVGIKLRAVHSLLTVVMVKLCTKSFTGRVPLPFSENRRVGNREMDSTGVVVGSIKRRLDREAR